LQNLEPTHYSAVADHPSAVSDVLDRVAGIGPALLLPGEQEAEYAEFALAIVKDARPRDAIEDLLMRDVIDLSWEVLRLRRLKAGLLRGATSSRIYQVMCRLGYEDEYAGELAANWAAGKKAAHKTVAVALQKAQVTMEDVMAETLEARSTHLSASTDCWQVRKPAATMLCGRSSATAQLLAPRCDKGLMKFRTRNSLTSIPEKSVELRRHDQRPATARQSRQREIEHRAQDCGGKGSRGAKCISTWLECPSSLGSFTRAGGRGDGA
jgi:hypothetical protein